MTSAKAGVILPGSKYTSDCIPEGRKFSLVNGTPTPTSAGSTMSSELDPFADASGVARMSQIESVIIQILSGAYDVTGQITAQSGYLYTFGDGGNQNYTLVSPSFPVVNAGSPIGQALITACLPMFLKPGAKLTLTWKPYNGEFDSAGGAQVGSYQVWSFNHFLPPFIHTDVFGFTD